MGQDEAIQSYRNGKDGGTILERKGLIWNYFKKWHATNSTPKYLLQLILQIS